MKKRILTLALATTMVFASITTAFAANDSAGTGDVEVEGVVTEEEVKQIEGNTVLEAAEGTTLPEGAKIVIESIKADHTDYTAVTQFVASNKEVLKADAYAVIDLKIADASGNVVKLESGKVKVTLPVMESVKDAKFVAVYRLDDTTKKFVKVGVAEVVGGKISFETDHFSTYVFAAVDSADAADKITENVQTGDTASVLPIVVMGVCAALALSAVLVISKKKNA